MYWKIQMTGNVNMIVHPCGYGFVPLDEDWDRNLHHTLYTWIVVELCGCACGFGYCRIHIYAVVRQCGFACVTMDNQSGSHMTSHMNNHSPEWMSICLFSFFFTKYWHHMIHIYTVFHGCWWASKVLTKNTSFVWRSTPSRTTSLAFKPFKYR